MSQPRSTLARDVASAYLASGMRILSWVVVLGLVYRKLGPEAFGLLAMLRATIGILNYTSLGLGPAIIWMLSGGSGDSPRRHGDTEGIQDDASVLRYAQCDTPQSVGASPESRALANGLFVALLGMLAGAIVAYVYAAHLDQLHRIRPGQLNEAAFLVIMLAAGTIIRLFSDVFGAAIQMQRRITTDNLLLAGAEVVWAAVCWAALAQREASLSDVGNAYATASMLLLVGRVVARRGFDLPLTFYRWTDPRMVRRLLAYGLLVTLSQLGDFLYAPVDYILINRFLSPSALAAYAPAVQIDAAMLVLVSALAAVILPRSALAHAAGDHRLVRRYYVRGTLACCGILTAAAVVIYLASPLIFKLWLKDPMVSTQAILPLVLAHTVVGGSSAIGRAVLLGAGKVKAYTTSVLIAGVGNVVLSYVFVAVFNLGLTGIILGTIVVVTARCAIWMPWYVMRQITRSESLSAPDAAPPSLAP